MSLIAIKRKSQRILKPVLWLFAGIFLLSCFTLYGNYKVVQNEEQESIAKVHDQDIPRAEYKHAYDRYRSWFRSQGGLDAQFMVARMAFDNLVDEYLRERAARGMGLGVNDREVRARVDQEIEGELQRLGAGLRGTELEQYRERLRAMPENQVEVRRRQLLGENLDAELKKAARPVEVRAAQIVIKADKRSRQQAFELARKAYERAAASGADFGALARSQSEDEATKTKGGELDWIKVDRAMGSMGMTPPGAPAPEVVATAYRLKKGQVSEPIPTTDGYVVLKVTEERPFVSTKKDEKERKAEVDAHKEQVGQAIVSGYHAMLQHDRDVQPLTPFVRGLMAEKEVGPGERFSETSPEGKAKLQEAVVEYERAASTDGVEIGPAFDYHLGQLYQRLDQPDKAVLAFQRAVARVNAAEVRMALGNVQEKQSTQLATEAAGLEVNAAKQEKSGKKAEAAALKLQAAEKRKQAAAAKEAAVQQFVEASKVAYNAPGIHAQLEEAFKRLKRPDLAKAEAKKNQKELVELQARQKAQQEQQRLMLARQTQAAAAKAAADKKAAAAKAAADKAAAVKPADAAARPGAGAAQPVANQPADVAPKPVGTGPARKPTAAAVPPPPKPD
jgi:parvulin-like peptidyl-prolyl isomerase